MILAVIAMAFQALATPAGGWCNSGTRAARMDIFTAIASHKLSDTTLRVAVCYAPSARAGAIGSYHARLFFDSLTAKVVRVESLAGGVRVENIARPGVIDFAGAAGSGFEKGPLVAFTLRVTKGRNPKLDLEMIEANSTKKESVLSKLRIAGRVGPAATASVGRVGADAAACQVGASTRAPTLRRLVPAVIPIDSINAGAIVKVSLEGCGLESDRNVIRLSGSTVAEVASSDRGTRLQFFLPAQLVSGGEVAPPRLGPGSYSVTVTTVGGTSNSLTLVVR